MTSREATGSLRAAKRLFVFFFFSPSFFFFSTRWYFTEKMKPYTNRLRFAARFNCSWFMLLLLDLILKIFSQNFKIGNKKSFNRT